MSSPTKMFPKTHVTSPAVYECNVEPRSQDPSGDIFVGRGVLGPRFLTVNTGREAKTSVETCSSEQRYLARDLFIRSNIYGYSSNT